MPCSEIYFKYAPNPAMVRRIFLNFFTKMNIRDILVSADGDHTAMLERHDRIVGIMRHIEENFTKWLFDHRVAYNTRYASDSRPIESLPFYKSATDALSRRPIRAFCFGGYPRDTIRHAMFGHEHRVADIDIALFTATSRDDVGDFIMPSRDRIHTIFSKHASVPDYTMRVLPRSDMDDPNYEKITIELSNATNVFKIDIVRCGEYSGFLDFRCSRLAFGVDQILVVDPLIATHKRVRPFTVDDVIEDIRHNRLVDIIDPVPKDENMRERRIAKYETLGFTLA